MARVFVSHSTDDLSVALELRTWLRGEGHRVFLDHDVSDGIELGEQWRKRLCHELRATDAVVCVITTRYLASEWRTAEVGIADAWGLRGCCRCWSIRASHWMEAEHAALLAIQRAAAALGRHHLTWHLAWNLGHLSTTGEGTGATPSPCGGPRWRRPPTCARGSGTR